MSLTPPPEGIGPTLEHVTTPGEDERSGRRLAALPSARIPRNAFAHLGALADHLPLSGSRQDLVDTLATHLPRVLGDHRIELGLLDDRGEHVTAHLLHGGDPGELPVTTYTFVPGCLAGLEPGSPPHVLTLAGQTHPSVVALRDKGYVERVTVPITLGRSLVGGLAVTAREVIPARLVDLAALAGTVVSSRAHRLVDAPPTGDPHALQAQLTALLSTTRALERTDALTQLPNRAAAFEAIGEARAAARGEASFAFIDLDHLKMTNDRLGHGSGDRVLRAVAERLRAIDTSAPTMVFRVGGDEFGALSEGPAEELRDALEAVAEDLAHHPVQVGGRDVPAAFSAGVYAITGHGHGIEEIVSRAESAAYQAKRSGRGRVLVHVPSADGQSDTHGELRRMDAVRSAVLGGRLTMVAQPVTSVVSDVDAPMDAEVLVRLVDEDGRLLLPDDFVVLAEQYDVVNALDRAVLTRVVETLDRESTHARVSCNVSPHSMLDGAFVDWAEELVRRSGQAGRLVVELTERLPIGSTSAVRAGMDHLAATGVAFALDDFGAGTTSYGNLRDLPVDVLKVDGVLVRGCLTSAVDLAMLRSTLDVARALGIRAVCEGVETREQLARVVELGADAVQGYYFGQPVPWPPEPR